MQAVAAGAVAALAWCGTGHAVQEGTMRPETIAVPSVPGLEINVESAAVVLRGEGAYYGAVQLFKFANGEMTLAGMRSRDAGRTWVKAGIKTGTGACQLPDGDLVQLGFRAKNTSREGVYEIPLTRSTDNGMTGQEETAIMSIPDGVACMFDDGGNSFPGCGVADHAMVRLRDGSLLAAMYGLFKIDKVVDPMTAGLRKKYPDRTIECYKNRSWVVRSTDRGKTWSYLSTVAYDLTEGDRVRMDGFCEPDLLTLPNGNILCFMRTGGAGGQYRPLYLSQSNDDGKTWSHADPIADRGVCPNSCLLANGVIAVVYGRPDNWMMFSLDQGQTWTGNFFFWRYRDGATTDYIAVEEVEPDVLLVAYDRQTADAQGTLAWEVVAMRVSVKRR
jgi:hypothetical protein